MIRLLLAVAGLAAGPAALFAQAPFWAGYGGNSQHTAVSTVASQPLQAIHWQTPLDLNPQYSGSGTYLLTHYGSPAITQGNTVIIPVKTGATDGFRVEARAGATGALLWTQATDYSVPPHSWIPMYSPVVAPGNQLYYPGAGGTIYTRGNLDAAGAVAPTQLAFYGLGAYTANQAAYNANVKISTPITADAAGNIYFGYYVADPGAVGNLQSGFAKITPTGAATYVPASSLAPTGSPLSIQSVAMNCAPAVSADGTKVYIAVSTATNGPGSQSGSGYLVGLNASNLTAFGHAELRDVKTPGNWASVNYAGTAAPMIGPDGDVYYGVLRNSSPTSYRGWMLHFNGALTQQKTAASFGWDSTASVVPKAMVPSYTGTSDYLIFTKYNNYVGSADGQNKIAILDPNDTQIDPLTGATVMKEILTKLSPTPELSGNPQPVTEWCINTAVVDPSTNSVLVNNADGKLYRWDLSTDTLSEVITLTDGILEAYTPTVMGPDGTVYAVNDTILFAVGAPVPEPASVLALAAGVVALGAGVRRLRRRATSVPSP